MKQTAVEYLVENLIKLGYLHSKNYGQSKIVKKVIEQAKEMEKNQIINTFKDAQVFKVMNDEIRAEQYFNKTYK
jgi:fructose-specific component phosphotransferase system IIB-like protein